MNKEIFYNDPCLVIYIPGYLSGTDKQEEAVDKLNELYHCNPDDPDRPWVTVFNWDSATGYAKAMHNSIDAASELVEYLKELPCTPDVTLIGHSLGALVIANAVLKIPANVYYHPKQIILLGAALNANFNLKPMCSITDYPVINVVNPKDTILSTAYRAYNDSPALGQVGSRCKNNKNYVELQLLSNPINRVMEASVKNVINSTLDIVGHSASRVYVDGLIKGQYKIK